MPITSAPNAVSGRLVVRILPAEEWDRVKAIEPFASRGLPDADSNWMILVVERDGQIVGSCSLFQTMHWDAWYIDPAVSGAVRGVILRQLLAVCLEILGNLDIEQVYTGVEPDATSSAARLLKRFGFTPTPGQLFVLNIAEAALALRQQEH
jgi:hypothetical protein